MRRAPAIIGTAIFLVIAPGTLAGYVPWHFTQWRFEPALFPIARVIGGILIAAGDLDTARTAYQAALAIAERLAAADPDNTESQEAVQVYRQRITDLP